MSGMDIERETAVDITKLFVHPDNPRRGNLEAIADSMREHGQYSTIGVQKSTGYVLYGNHRLMAARDMLGWKHIDVDWLDVDDIQATKILLVDNRTSDIGAIDDRDLAELLGTLDDFDGTGYTQKTLDDLLKSLGDWEGLDEPDPTPQDDDDMGKPIQCPHCEQTFVLLRETNQ